MAVENKYTDADIVAGKKALPWKTAAGSRSATYTAVATIAAADDDGSIYRIFKDVPASYVPQKIEIHNTAITGGTVYHLGIYLPSLGGVVDVDALAATSSMATARLISVSNNEGMNALTLGETKSLAELAAAFPAVAPSSAYDIALTGATVGSANGTIRVTATFAYAS